VLFPGAENYQINRSLLEGVRAGRAGESNESGGRQLLPADPPHKAEALRALGASCDSEGHALILREIVDVIRCQPDTSRHLEISDKTLSEIRTETEWSMCSADATPRNSATTRPTFY
jgi:hypothetical protein